MKHFLLFLLIFISYCGFSQNYKGVVEWDTTYFLCKFELPYYPMHTDSNRLRVIYTDSVKNIGADKYLYFYKTVKNYYPNTNINCFDTLASSWMGNYSIVKSNGDELYFNFKGDTILIRTQAVLNDTWKIAKDTNGIEIWGTFNQEVFGSIDSQQDTIKIITLQAYSGGLPVAHLHNNLQLKLSKNHGFLTAFEWDFFPYTQVPYGNYFYMIDTQLHTRLDKHYVEKDLNYINFQTMFNPGTYWQLRDTGYTIVGHPQYPLYIPYQGLGVINVYTQDSVINKIIINSDTMVVEFQRILKYNHSVVTAPVPPNPNPSYQDTNITVIYNHIDTIVKKPKFTIKNNLYPESKLSYEYNLVLPPSIANIPTYSVIQYSDSMFFLRVNNNTEETYITNTSLNCISHYAGVSGKNKVCKGFIRQINYTPTYLYLWSGTEVERDVNNFMYFYHDSSVTIGTPLNLKTLSVDEISISDNPIKIYPNPSLSGNFNLSSSKSIEWDVFDIRGVKLISGHSSQLNLQSYPSGIYLLKARCNGKTYYSKLMR